MKIRIPPFALPFVMLLGPAVLPTYRRQGLAKLILQEYSRAMFHTQNRKKLILTCLEEKVPMYAAWGFHDEGLANSTFGGESWHQMSLDL